MAVKSSGALSLTTDIVGEFGGVAPHSLSEYYGGGTYVPAGANPGVATSGQINMNSFYDTVAATVLTISSNTNNYDIGAAAIAAGGDKSTPVILTINAGVTVGSTSSSTPAMKTGTGWSSGTTINITNNGSIVGKAGGTSSGKGNGGNGGKGSTSCGGGSPHGGAGTSGGSATSTNAGGNAFEHSQTSDNNLSVIFDTTGTRSGGAGGAHTATGGGGGGGGSKYWRTNGYSYSLVGGYGGGGGAGTSGGSGGAGGEGYNAEYGGCGWNTGDAGSSGGSTSGGNGGYSYNQRGGRGGNLNANGSNGYCPHSYCAGTNGSGGAAGSNGTFYGSSGSALSGNTGQIS